MKINGIEQIESLVETVVIPKTGQEFVFKLRGVTNFEGFEKIYPEPKPKVRTMAGTGEKISDFSSSEFQELISKRNQAQSHWIILESIKETEGLEFETVNMDDPQTWGNYMSELKSFGFSIVEINYIIQAVYRASGMDGEKIEEATKSFLDGRRKAREEA